MIKKTGRNDMRKIRHNRVRAKVFGIESSPRLNVFRSNTHIYAQIINDENDSTLVSASSLEKELNLKNGSNMDAASAVGEILAKRALELGISKVVFDRGGYLYHGRVKALAEKARQNGLEF